MGNRWVFGNDPHAKNTTPKDYKLTVALLATQCTARKKAAAKASQVVAQEHKSAAQGHKSAVQESKPDGKESKSASEGSESAGEGSESAANSEEHKSVTFDSTSDEDH